ncbi:MAG: hypothetical protein IPP45_19640 [Sphingomonadales bacterium]|nr:hypothetical protein [Sphingomonadales bacterium]
MQTLAASEIGIIVPSGRNILIIWPDLRAGWLLHHRFLGWAADRNIGVSAPAFPAVQSARARHGARLALLFPVLCWSPDVGTALAKAVMAGDFQPMLVHDLRGKQASLFSLIRSASPATNGQLKGAIPFLPEAAQ